MLPQVSKCKQRLYVKQAKRLRLWYTVKGIFALREVV